MRRRRARNAASIRRSINSFQARIIWQISPKNKLAVYNDRLLKNRGAAMTAGFDPATASVVWNSPIYTTGSVKLTSTVTSQILVEGGFSTNYERYNTSTSRASTKSAGTPEWYTTINKQDTALGTQWNAGVDADRACIPIASPLAGSVVVRHRRAQHQGRRPGHVGPLPPYRSANGDIRAVFQNGVAVPGARS